AVLSRPGAVPRCRRRHGGARPRPGGHRPRAAPRRRLSPEVRPMRILEHGVYRGPHLYSHRPMVRIQVDLGALEDWPTDRLPGFPEALLAVLPTLHNHNCSRGHPGGFVERLHAGPWLGHVVEPVVLELPSPAGVARARG